MYFTIIGRGDEGSYVELGALPCCEYYYPLISVHFWCFTERVRSFHGSLKWKDINNFFPHPITNSTGDCEGYLSRLVMVGALLR